MTSRVVANLPFLNQSTEMAQAAAAATVILSSSSTPPRSLHKLSQSHLVNPHFTSSHRLPISSASSTTTSPSRSHRRRRHSTGITTSSCTPSFLKYYAHLASKLAESGKLNDFLMIAESVLTSDAVAGQLTWFAPRINVGMVSRGISKVLSGDGGEGVAEVIGFLSRARKLGFSPSALFEKQAIEALGLQCHRILDERRFEEFVELMETLAGHKLYIREVLDPMDVLKVLLENCNVEMAMRYADIFPNNQVLLTSVMHECGKKHDMASAMLTFELIKKKPGSLNMFACRCIVDICGLCGDYLRSRSIFEELLAQKIIPNTYVFNSLMNVNAHDLSYTLHLHRLMQDLGVSMDMTSYNILLKACCTAKMVDLAQVIYQEIKQMAFKGSLKLDIFTYTTMIKLFADAKLWHLAMNIKEDMLLAGVSPNIVTWSSLIAACAKAGLVDHAVRMFEEMVLAGCEPNAQCYNSLLSACVEACQYDRAFRLYNSWKERGFQISCNTDRLGPGTEHQILPEDCVDTADGQPTCGSHVPQPLSDNKVLPFRPTVATYNILIKACGTDYHRAKALMNEMNAVGLSPNHISWSILIDIYGISKNMKCAMEAFKMMRDAGFNPDVIAYTTAIKACVENKNMKIAFSIFEEMKRHQIQPNLVTYNTLLRARSSYGSLNEVQECLSIYQDMRNAGYSANDYYLKELIEEWCEGVICGGQQGQRVPSSVCSKTNKHKSGGLLLDKIAKHLQKDVYESYTVDVRGLTKVEARIVVLSVLRMLKENFNSGEKVKHDLIIIAGAGNISNDNVHNAITSVLHDELGFEVISGHKVVAPGNRVAELVEDDDKHIATLRLPKANRYLTRRPQDLGVLKVTMKSLSHWLQKNVH